MFRLSDRNLLRDRAYFRLWTSILTSGFGAQITTLALPLTAVVLLHATPTQMGLMTAMQIAPFILFSLPGGVWLDRVRKLPVYVVGEWIMGLVLATVPLAWWLGWLSMPWMYAVSFVIGAVYTVAGSAAQIVLTQVVPRERLVEAHAKNALANSASEVAGPGLAGALIKLLGAPVALLVNAGLLIGSAVILKGLAIREELPPSRRVLDWSAFRRDLMEGLRFVVGHHLLALLAVVMAVWQMANHAAVVVQILYATRTLGMSEDSIGLSYIGLGVGTVIASIWGRRLSHRIGPGPAMVVGMAVTGFGRLLLSVAPDTHWGVAAFCLMLTSFSLGSVLLFINFLALRQAVTPEPLLGRMTTTMRWMTLLAAAPGALLGGWVGEHLGLRWTLAFSGLSTLLLALACWRIPRVTGLRSLPSPESPPLEDRPVG